MLEGGIPLWRFSKNGIRMEKRVLMPHLQNTTYIVYRLIEGPAGLKLKVRPSLHFRPHEGLLTNKVSDRWSVRAVSDNEIEIRDGSEIPPLRIHLCGGGTTHLRHDIRTFEHVLYRVEKSRGYEYEGPLWSPGVIEAGLEPGDDCAIVASVEPWDIVRALSFGDAITASRERHERLLSIASIPPSRPSAAQLVLAADQFLIHPHARAADEARVRASGDEPRTIIAGYHWFTDWGRDTMISLEGLTLTTGRHTEAGYILRTFGHYVRDGLIPNMFPEGEREGLYHTADATLWFFHAVNRYVESSGDRLTLARLYPTLKEIIARHVQGTAFGIHVDPADGLAAQGAPGYQLTWMDAKVDDWVVTPRRGKAVEINALWFNALKLMEEWAEDHGDRAEAYRDRADQARRSFNERFWYAEGGYLYDVIDGEAGGADPKCRPNQIFAIALPHPVLLEHRWEPVMRVVRDRLATPVGLRSLAPGDEEYKSRYFGDLRARDAAYHQGTVWAWLAGPYIDAWLKVYPDDWAGAQRVIDGFVPHLNEACIGSISEVFDAEPPYTPRGCIAQAWSVAEVLRVWVKLASRAQQPAPSSSDVVTV